MTFPAEVTLSWIADQGQVVFPFLCGSTDTPHLPKMLVNDLAWYFFKDIIKEAYRMKRDC
jgi:hypothetical protein